MDVHGTNVVVCLVCKDKLKYSGSTSNMMKHLRTRHPTECAEFKEDADMEIAAKHPRPSTSDQLTLIEAITWIKLYMNDSNKKKELDALVVRMIVEDLQPIPVVEFKGFRRLINGLNQRYDLPSCRETFYL